MTGTISDTASGLTFQAMEHDFAAGTKEKTSIFARPTFDDNYLTRLRNRDEETARHFDTYFRRLLRSWLWGKFHWEQEEELIDSAMTAAFEKISQGQPRDAARLPAYVTGICLNLTRLAMRPSFNKNTSKTPEVLQIEDSAADAEEELLSRERAQEVRKVLTTLGQRDREILLDLFYHEKDRDEVCKRHRLDRENLRLILFRARKRFRTEWNSGRRGRS